MLQCIKFTTIQTICRSYTIAPHMIEAGLTTVIMSSQIYFSFTEISSDSQSISDCINFRMSKLSADILAQLISFTSREILARTFREMIYINMVHTIETFAIGSNNKNVHWPFEAQQIGRISITTSGDNTIFINHRF